MWKLRDVDVYLVDLKHVLIQWDFQGPPIMGPPLW